MTQSSITVLAADDSFIIKTLERYLGAEGIDVLTASTGEGILQKLAEEGIDLVILSARLPGFDGMEVCRQIRSNPETENIPIIILAISDTFSGQRQSAQQAGADLCLEKPFLRSELTEAVKALLEKKIQRPVSKSFLEEDS